MFKKLFLSIIFSLVFVSFAIAFDLDVCDKIYESDNYILKFQKEPFGPGCNGILQMYNSDFILIGLIEYHQNVGDPIVNMDPNGVFYQSPSDVLTYIPPPFLVFNPVK